MQQLKNKVAVITGGGTGIGEAVCHIFAKEGAKVIVNVSDEAEAERCINEAVKTFGQLDILINNAGILLVNAPTDEFPVEAFDEHIRHNIRSTFLMTKFALPHLR